MPPQSPAPPSTLPGSVTLVEFETIFGELVGDDGDMANLIALAGHMTASWDLKVNFDDIFIRSFLKSFVTSQLHLHTCAHTHTHTHTHTHFLKSSYNFTTGK